MGSYQYQNSTSVEHIRIPSKEFDEMKITMELMVEGAQ